MGKNFITPEIGSPLVLVSRSYPKRTIYLAGPITGLTHEEARYGWRKEFVEQLATMGADHISCNSPMRGKEFLATHGVLSSGHDYPDNAMATDAGITTRDYNDVKNCDAMVACFLESGGRPSLGTAMEYGFAYSHQKPVIAVGPLKIDGMNEPNINHLMLQRVAGYRVDTIEEAALICYHLLTPGV